MKPLTFILALALLSACSEEKKTSSNPMYGTWKLLSGTLVEKGDTTVTDYTKTSSFIKIINETHFAFLLHDLNKGRDSAAVYSSGGGKYTFNNGKYTEYLEYCTARDWEGHEFNFDISFNGDTLIQSGVEKIDSLGIERHNTERYVRIK